MLNWRHLTRAMAFALVNAASSPHAARAGCRREWQCGRHGCSWQGLWSTADFRYLISLASPGSLAGGSSGALR